MSREKELKKRLSLVDATPLLQKVLEVGKSGTAEEKKECIAALEQAYDSSGQLAIERAVRDGTTTLLEVATWQQECDASMSDVGLILSAHYAWIDQDGPVYAAEPVYIVTMPGSGVWKMKEIAQRLHVGILTPGEVLKRLRVMKNEK